MKELIEKLKVKTLAQTFGLLTPREQECLKKVGKGNLLIYHSDDTWDPSICGSFSGNLTYAIKPDYQPEPEFEDIEITKQGTWLGIVRPWAGDYSRFPFDFTHLHCLPSLPNFDCFWIYEFDKSGQNITLICIARHINEGKKVFARFRA